MPPSPSPLPAPSPHQIYVTISALHSGTLTLPSHQLITPTSPSARRTVPSLSFLIQHPSPPTLTENNTPPPTHLLFDLGPRKPLSGYPAPIRKHIETRQPINGDNDVVQSLARGCLKPEDVDWVILSHVHWDHIGTPLLFAKNRVVELHRATTFDSPITVNRATDYGTNGQENEEDDGSSAFPQGIRWQPLAHFPSAIDFFQDGSLYLIDAPGHLPGHLNILARIEPKKWIYLAGDACHDRRILTGEVGVAKWEDAEGKVSCIHSDVEEAEKTLEKIRVLGCTEEEVEVVLAHDGDWAEDKGNEARFWPGVL